VVEKPKEPAPPIVVVQVGLDVSTRSWGYVTKPSSNLRGYSAPAIFLPAARLELYPLARTGNAALAGIGLEGGYQMSVGLSSASKDGPTFPSSVTRMDAGLRYKLPALVDGKLGLSVFGGYRIHSFRLSPAKDGTVITGLPNPTWTAARAGAGVSWKFGAVSAFLEGAALPLLGTGELQKSYFPKTTGLGLEGQAGADIALNSMLGLRLAGFVTRYATSFTTEPTAEFVATGAVDLYAGGTAAVRLSF
jgi:hypothetical protein